MVIRRTAPSEDSGPGLSGSPGVVKGTLGSSSGGGAEWRKNIVRRYELEWEEDQNEQPEGNILGIYTSGGPSVDTVGVPGPVTNVPNLEDYITDLVIAGTPGYVPGTVPCCPCC